jgi:hypothetical protein
MSRAKVNRKSDEDTLARPLLQPINQDDVEAGKEAVGAAVKDETAASASTARMLVISFALMVAIGLGNKVRGWCSRHYVTAGCWRAMCRCAVCHVACRADNDSRGVVPSCVRTGCAAVLP